MPNETNGGHAAGTHVPLRLHHTAYVVKDQRATRRFYEELIGLELAATWTEKDFLFGADRVYCHTFYTLADGSALAFFQFAEERDYEEFGPQFRPTPFIHVALKTEPSTQDAIVERLERAGYDHYVLEHGYCRSMYVTDPDGLLLEFTVDHPDVAEISAERRRMASSDFERWLGGDHTSNNTYRPADEPVNA